MTNTTPVNASAVEGIVAEKIVDEIVKDLNSRRGLRQEWDSIDEDIQQEIKEVWISIVTTHASILSDSTLREVRDDVGKIKVDQRDTDTLDESQTEAFHVGHAYGVQKAVSIITKRLEK